MTDIDQIARRLSDLETVVREQGYRLRALEKAGEQFGPSGFLERIKQLRRENGRCPCGRDVCRAPDCPSHKPDPMGR